MRTLTKDLSQHIGQEVTLQGWVHWRRNLGGIQFLVLRDRSGIAQCVLSHDYDVPIAESVVEVRGSVVESRKAPGGLEIQANGLTIIAKASHPAPVEVAKEEWRANPETLLDYRYVSLRGLKERAVLSVQARLVQLFREFLIGQSFTEIFTPKIVSAGAEGGANLFEVDYFGQKAFLAQSPQLYKQIMVGVYERVFETAPVYRAEEHATSRHLNEYLSLDLEIGFINDENDVMDIEEELLSYIMPRLREQCAADFVVLGVEAPKDLVKIPRIPLAEARALIREQYNYQVGGKDIDPEGERLLSRHFEQTTGSEYVFVTHYPRDARPFYAHPSAGGLTRSFDLLYRGIEITSGGQRIHEYDVLVESLLAKGNDPVGFAGYLEVFKHGMPPHGGFAIGAERLTAKMLGIHNVRYARAFPRDRNRLTP
jgi:nondiscriminating aspartyl-tRNA synthetase